MQVVRKIMFLLMTTMKTTMMTTHDHDDDDNDDDNDSGGHDADEFDDVHPEQYGLWHYDQRTPCIFPGFFL